MSTQAHTPGPWTWHWNKDRDGYADGRVGTDPKTNTIGMSVCVAVSPRFVDQPQWEADARLIAAAPDLLAAAKLFLEGDGHDDFTDEWPALRAAVAKAEGRPIQTAK